MSGEQPEVLNLDTIAMLYDAIGDDLNGIIELYIVDVPRDLEFMRQALATNDLTTVHRLSHSLKSSSANLGAMQISTLAADLEHSIKDGETNVEALGEKLTAISVSFDQTRSMLESLEIK